jgi:hypothetical protein
LTNKTLTSPTINTPKIAIGSDASGDLHYSSDANGTQARLAKGTDGKILKLVSGLPSWETENAAVDASSTVKGVVEIATAAEITAGTATGGTGAVLAISPDQLASSTPVFNGSGLTSVKGSIIKNGTTTYDTSTASGTQTIAHGCGRTPIMVRLSAFCAGVSGNTATATSHGVYNGTTNSCIYFTPDKTAVAPVINNSSTQAIYLRRYDNGGATDTSAAGVVTVDATNITITWTKSGSQTGTAQILWEAIA